MDTVMRVSRLRFNEYIPYYIRVKENCNVQTNNWVRLKYANSVLSVIGELI